MKVILQENIDKVGKAGDVVEIAPGYFRNFLQPRHLAVEASQGALKKRQEDLEALRKKAAALHEAHLELANKITALGKLTISAKAGEGGKLYGKITNKEIALELKKALDCEIDKRLVKSAEEIAALGTYPVQIKLSPEAQAELSIEVVPQDKQ
ncbi:MAG: 50S ribosomal protein L9 [Candidatus Melainabacteria bacterium]|nr:50S ribosomal protein L9 [Candidatus Melainabacteria bacterium]